MISLREYILLEKPWQAMAVSVFASFPPDFRMSPRMTNFFYWFQIFFFFQKLLYWVLRRSRIT